MNQFTFLLKEIYLNLINYHSYLHLSLEFTILRFIIYKAIFNFQGIYFWLFLLKVSIQISNFIIFH